MNWSSYMNGLCSLLILTLISVLTANDHGECNHDDHAGAQSEDDQCFDDPQSSIDQLTRIDPKEVGYIEQIQFVEERLHQRVTRAVKPPLFEVEEFLTAEECDHIQELALNNGLSMSGLFVQTEEEDVPQVGRVSSHGHVHMGADDVMKNIKRRLTQLVQLPSKYLDESENIQVVKYEVGGYYHTHVDSGPLMSSALPCCHQSQECRPATADCCQICRYITVLMYLNDVEEGGETVFPVADTDNDTVENLEAASYEAYNLTSNCYNSSVIVKPRKGSAIMWYNNHIDENGWIGDLDLYSYHGGCDVIRGEKWIASAWIAAGQYGNKDHPSIYKHA